MTGSGPLSGVRVVDASTVLAGPLTAQILGDFGADVVKIEHPQAGDSFRHHGAVVDGHGVWWKTVARNKRTVGLYLGDPDGAEVFKRIVRDTDVLVENFRPGTLEKWGLGPDVLHAINPRLVIARITGFGQNGPYASRAGFGTLAEAMSGFAAATGEPDGLRGGVGGDDGVVPPRHREWSRSSDRPVVARTHDDGGRTGTVGVFAHRSDSASGGQSLGGQRTAQHVSHRRWSLGRHLHLGHSHRRTRDAARRPG